MMIERVLIYAENLFTESDLIKFREYLYTNLNSARLLADYYQDTYRMAFYEAMQENEDYLESKTQLEEANFIYDYVLNELEERGIYEVEDAQ